MISVGLALIGLILVIVAVIKHKPIYGIIGSAMGFIAALILVTVPGIVIWGIALTIWIYNYKMQQS